MSDLQKYKPKLIDPQPPVPGYRPGWFYFPCVAGGKEPALQGNWREHASGDPAQLKAWLAAGYNLALDCGRSGVVVVDLDTDKETGATVGEAMWTRLQAEHGDVAGTYEAATPSGGAHLYFKGTAPSTVSKLAPKVDTRGEGGYVLVAPSMVAGKPYEPVDDGDLEPLPAWIGERLAASTEGKSAAPGVELDQPHNVERAIRWLQGRPPLAESDGADAGTLYAANVVMDFGLSAEKAGEVLLEHLRIEPRDDRFEAFIERKVGNAERYRQNAVGAWAQPPHGERFAGYAPEPSAMAGAPIVAVPLRLLLERTATPVRELVGGLLQRDILTFLSGVGGLHKSRLALQWGLCINAATPIFGRPTEQATFVYLSGEDEEAEVIRRVQAITRKLKLPNAGPEALYFDLTRGQSAVLLEALDTGEVRRTPLFEQWAADLAQRPGHKFVVFDSVYNFVRFHGQAKINEDAVKGVILGLQGFLDAAGGQDGATGLALWHPSQAGSERADGAGWSVAWHNTPRARLTVRAARESEEGVIELAAVKRNHAAKGAPITLYWSEGAMLPRSDLTTADQSTRFRAAAVGCAIKAATMGTPLTAQRKIGNGHRWALDTIEHAAGFRPSDSQVKEELAAAVIVGELRYIRGTAKMAAGYYPPDQAAAEAMATRRSGDPAML